MPEALPCVICGRTLESVEDDSPAQPHEGTNFSSHGHYGSTAFDPMDGSFITFNVCDPCLRHAGDRGRVACGRSSRPVEAATEIMPGRWMNTIVGFERLTDATLIPWESDVASFDADDRRVLTLEDFDGGLPETIHLHLPAEDVESMLRRLAATD